MPHGKLLATQDKMGDNAITKMDKQFDIRETAVQYIEGQLSDWKEITRGVP